MIKDMGGDEDEEVLKKRKNVSRRMVRKETEGDRSENGDKKEQKGKETLGK